MILKEFAKKSLGQNFLTDDNIKRKIIEVCQLTQNDFVLEIGPGRGALTREIAKRVKSITAVEKDTRLCGNLVGLLDEYKNLILINEDILNFKISQDDTKVIGNIPYNISSPIIEYLIDQKEKVKVIYICLQKELAKRIVAKPGGKDYGSFSLFVQYSTEPEIKFIIKKGCFRPQPKVDSAFVELKIRKPVKVKVQNEQFLFKIIRTSFNQRRKMISNTLGDIVDIKKIAETGIKPSSRPEELSLEDFVKIANSAG